MGKVQHYCAFCRSPKFVYKKSKTSLLTLPFLFLASSLLGFFLRKQVDEFILYIFFSVLVLVELCIKIRYRLSLACRDCGFDPMLYKKSPQKACDLVRQTLERRDQDPQSLLKRSLSLPKITHERKEFWEQLAKRKNDLPQISANEIRGQLLSKQI